MHIFIYKFNSSTLYSSTLVINLNLARIKDIISLLDESNWSLDLSVCLLVAMTMMKLTKI